MSFPLKNGHIFQIFSVTDDFRLCPGHCHYAESTLVLCAILWKMLNPFRCKSQVLFHLLWIVVQISLKFFVFFFMAVLFIFGCPGSSLLCGLFSSCGERGPVSSLLVSRSHFSLQSSGSRAHGLSSFSTWAQELWLPGSRAQAQ